MPQEYVSFPGLGRYGRLGNALFQIAATWAHARRFGLMPRFPPWEYAEAMGLPEEWFTGEPSPCIYDAGADGGGMVDAVTYAAPWNYQPIPEQARVLHGYFQCPLFWQEIEEDVQNMFRGVPQSFLHREHTAIHVRRGDYLQLNMFHPVLGFDYYERAVATVEARPFYAAPIILTDDPHWALEAFTNAFVSTCGPLRDLGLMVDADAVIMANSSFSWWGAYLSKAKLVIAPRNWFGPALPDHKTEQLYLPTWLRI